MQEIVVDVFESEADGWWWELPQLRSGVARSLASAKRTRMRRAMPSC
jgi:hypothetical protein